MYRVGEKAIGIHTAILDEKADALHILLVYATQLKHAFLPYVQQVADLALASMRFMCHEGVRIEACLATHILLDCVRSHLEHLPNNTDMTPLTTMVTTMVNALLEALTNEPDREVMLCQLEALDQVFGDMGQRCLSTEQVLGTLAIGGAVLDDWRERNDQRLDAKKERDHNDEDEEKLTEEETLDRKIARMVVEVMRKTLEHHADVYLPAFKSVIVPIALKLLDQNRHPFEKQRAICIFDDIAELQCATAIEYFPTMVPLLLTYATHTDHALRQACVYGLGVCGLNAGDAFAPYLADAIRVLSWVVQQPNSREEAAIPPTENAISALLKIINGQSTRINQAEILPLWLSYLPILEDEIEGSYCYEHLCKFLESGNPHIIGPQYSHMPHIIKVFSQVCNTYLVNPDTNIRIGTVLHNMQPHLPPGMVQSVWTSLTEPERNNLVALTTPPAQAEAPQEDVITESH